MLEKGKWTRWGSHDACLRTFIPLRPMKLLVSDIHKVLAEKGELSKDFHEALAEKGELSKGFDTDTPGPTCVSASASASSSSSAAVAVAKTIEGGKAGGKAGGKGDKAGKGGKSTKGKGKAKEETSGIASGGTCSDKKSDLKK